MLLLTDTDTTARDPLMPSQRLRPMLDFSMEDMDMVLDTTARDPLMLSQRLRPMLDFSMEDTDMVLDSDTPVLDCWIRLCCSLCWSWLRIRSWILWQEIR